MNGGNTVLQHLYCVFPFSSKQTLNKYMLRFTGYCAQLVLSILHALHRMKPMHFPPISCRRDYFRELYKKSGSQSTTISHFLVIVLICYRYPFTASFSNGCFWSFSEIIAFDTSIFQSIFSAGSLKYTPPSADLS